MSNHEDYGMSDPWEPEDKYEIPNNIEPIYQQLLGHLASATKIANSPTRTNIGRHIPNVEKARNLVKEAAIHSASFLPGRASQSLNDALDTLSPVIWAAGRDTRPDDFKSNFDRKDPAVKFHNHISDFFIKAHKETGGALPGEEGWDN